MINVIKSEYLKFKGTRTLLIIICGALLMPVIMTICHFFITASPTEFTESLKSVVSINSGFLLLIFSTLMINSLFGIDIKTDTLKSIVPLPISPGEYLNGKLINLILGMIIFTLISWIASMVLFAVVGMQGLVLNTCLNLLGQSLIDTILIFLIMTPIVLVYVVTKRSNLTILLIIALILAPTIIMLGGQMFSFIEPASQYLPWSFVGSIANNTLSIKPMYAYIITIVTFIAGYVLSYIYMKSRDIE